ncbi:hypothetical protein NUSPORA_01119 [Nucleospora cyclopteri]
MNKNTKNKITKSVEENKSNTSKKQKIKEESDFVKIEEGKEENKLKLETNAIVSDEINLSLFNSHSTSSIINIFQSLPDSSQKLISLIKECSIECMTHASLNKLNEVFISLENYNPEELLQLTASNIRGERSMACRLVFNRMIQEIKQEPSTFAISQWLDDIVKARYRDVDFSIRILTLNLISETNKHLNYAYELVFDANESVRKRALKVFSERATGRNKINLSTMPYLDRNKLSLLGQAESNYKIKTEIVKIFISLFVGNNLSKEEFIENLTKIIGLKNKLNKKALKTDNKILLSNKLKKAVIKKMLPNGLYDVKLIHFLILENNLHFLIDDLYSFDDFSEMAIEFIQKNSCCCKKQTFCLFSISYAYTKISIKTTHKLYEVLKDNKQNLLSLILCLKKIKNYVEEAEHSEKLVKAVFENVMQCIHQEAAAKENSLINDQLASALISFLAYLAESMHDLSMPMLFKLIAINNAYYEEALKHINLEERDEMTVVSRIYKCLWHIKNKEFDKITMEYLNPNDSLIELEEKETIICAQFLEFFIGKLKEIGEIFHCPLFYSPVDETEISLPTDFLSSVKIICCFLISIFKKSQIETNCDFDVALIILLKNNVFTDLSHVFFTSNQRKIDLLLKEDGLIKEMFVGLLKSVVETENEEKKVELGRKISRRIAESNYSKKERFVFKEMKEFLSRKRNSEKNESGLQLNSTFDKIDLCNNKSNFIVNCLFPLFINNLSVNECIVLEALVEEGKLKDMLMKRCKKGKTVII